jgi:hypothetical protein
MAAKPIAEVSHKGRVLVVDFAKGDGLLNGRSLRYDVIVNGRKALANAFAEEVMRWLARELTT